MRHDTASGRGDHGAPITVYALAVLALVGTGGLVGYLSGPAGEGSWYQGLEKSVLTPPGWVFGTVWPILYAMMAVAAVMVWAAKAHPLRGRALTVFAVQLLVNYTWSFVFFRAEMPLLAFIWIVVLIGLAAWTAILFKRVREAAGALLVPYLLWLSFASYLSLTIVVLN